MSMTPPAPPPGAMPPPPGYQPYQPGWQATPNYAGFGARLGALIIDILIAVVFVIPGIVMLFAGPSEIKGCTVDGVRGLCEVPTGSTIGIAVLLFLAGFIGFLVIYCRKVGTTGRAWGGQATGTMVVDATTGQPIGVGRAFGRTLFRYFISGSICYLGYLWMLWDPKKQTWHDKVVGSIVVRA